VVLLDVAEALLRNETIGLFDESYIIAPKLDEARKVEELIYSTEPQLPPVPDVLLK
jgi:hypothetical protein